MNPNAKPTTCQFCHMPVGYCYCSQQQYPAPVSYPQVTAAIADDAAFWRCRKIAVAIAEGRDQDAIDLLRLAK